MLDTEKMIKICLIVIGGLVAVIGALFIPLFSYLPLTIAGILILILGITFLLLALIMDDWKKIGFVILVDGVLTAIINIVFTWLFWGSIGTLVFILLIIIGAFLTYLGVLVIQKQKSP